MPWNGMGGRSARAPPPQGGGVTACGGGYRAMERNGWAVTYGMGGLFVLQWNFVKAQNVWLIVPIFVQITKIA